jgi:molybdopterin-guanine dinucleotide biosynthesis adapter protein
VARPALIGIAGWKNSGKTTLIERLIPALRKRGLTVATVKHSHHSLRPLDGATDGERHARAGAARVAVIGVDAWELAGVRQTTPPPDLERAAAELGPVDLILVEGFKSAAIPKIEVRATAGADPPLAPRDPFVIAIASNSHEEANVLPVLAREDGDGLAELIVRYLREP